MCRRTNTIIDTLVKTGECYLSVFVVRGEINDVFLPSVKGEDNGVVNRVQRIYLLRVRH